MGSLVPWGGGGVKIFYILVCLGAPQRSNAERVRSMSRFNCGKLPRN